MEVNHPKWLTLVLPCHHYLCQTLEFKLSVHFAHIVLYLLLCIFFLLLSFSLVFSFSWFPDWGVWLSFSMV